MLNRLLRALLPGACLLCDGPVPPHREPDLCEFCLEALPWNRAACLRCGEPLPSGRDAAAECLRCTQRPPPFARTIAPLRYESFPRAWVGRLKDHMGLVEGRVLGTLLADAAERFYSVPGAARPRCLIPVPLTARRLARRGHNQALTLARPVARRLGIPVLRHAARRSRPGLRQRGLSRRQRLENPTGTFTIQRQWSDAPCLAIVDDVMTTGATAAELARVLLTAGAGEVHVLSATRTPRGQRLGTIPA